MLFEPHDESWEGPAHAARVEMSGVIADAIGAGGALCSTISFAPQLMKIWREKASEDVSLRMYVLTVSAFTLWSIYGALLGIWTLVAANLVSLALASAILALQLRYRGRDRSRRPRARRARRAR